LSGFFALLSRIFLYRPYQCFAAPRLCTRSHPSTICPEEKDADVAAQMHFVWVIWSRLYGQVPQPLTMVLLLRPPRLMFMPWHLLGLHAPHSAGSRYH
jgi:hypothetical protein